MPQIRSTDRIQEPYGITPLCVALAPISDRAVRLYTVLSGKYGAINSAAFPSRATLAKDLDASISSIDRALDELVNVGAVEVIRRSLPSGQTSNLYRLKMSITPQSPVTRGASPVNTPLVTGEHPPCSPVNSQYSDSIDSEEREETDGDESSQEPGAVPSVPVSLSQGQTNGGLRNGRSKGRYALVEDAIADRAAAFIEWYADVAYPKHRKGARYMRRDGRDFDPALLLVTTYPDDARLRQMAEVFLLTDHKFASEGSRTIGQFAALAPWCDDKMREHRL